MPLSNPVIVLPGITASELRDEYSVKPETVWSAVINKEYERICQHPNNVLYEAREPARVRADVMFPLVYKDLIEELRHNLADKADRPVPVFPFPYDWRQPLEVIQEQLADFVDEVIERTKLLRHYHAAGYHEDPHVDLVGHSMGGLVITGYLQAYGAKARVGRVATLATPFRGSYEAPIKVLTGTASIGGGEQNSREREAARITPSLYHLLPDFPGAVVDAEGDGVDLFDADSWQQGVLDTLAEFIRLAGVEPGNATKRATDARQLLQSMLNQAKKFKQRTRKFQLSDAKLDASKWLCVVGVDAETRICLKMESVGGRPRYALSGEDRKNEWTKEGKSVLTGDNTVPYLGAKPDFLSVRNLVCVRPDDFGYWEIGDKLLKNAAGFHGSLPTLNLAQRLVVAHLRDAVAGDNHWARPAPDIDGFENWEPPIRGLRQRIKW